VHPSWSVNVTGGRERRRAGVLVRLQGSWWKVEGRPDVLFAGAHGGRPYNPGRPRGGHPYAGAAAIRGGMGRARTGGAHGGRLSRPCCGRPRGAPLQPWAPTGGRPYAGAAAIRGGMGRARTGGAFHAPAADAHGGHPDVGAARCGCPPETLRQSAFVCALVW
jgi:hypothetical protein